MSSPLKEYQPVRIQYSRFQLKQLVWKLRDVEDVPGGFERRPLRGPEDILNYKFLFKDLPKERVVVFCLNAKNGVVAIDVLSEGTLNSSLISPNEVFWCGVGHAATAIVLAHNHPSGNPEPSQEDIAITRQLVEAGKIMGIPVRDHIVVGAGQSYVSFAERALI
jgi:DNA repair protein RadC